MHAAPRSPTPTLTLTLEPAPRRLAVLCLARAERRGDGRRGLVRRARAGGAGGQGREHRRGAWADHDAEPRCCRSRGGAESAARAPATDAPTADTAAADAAGPVSMPSEQPQEMATTPAGAAEPSVLPAC